MTPINPNSMRIDPPLTQLSEETDMIRAKAMIDSISTKLDSINATFDRIEDSHQQSIRRQNMHISGLCERIGAIFASLLRYLGLIR